MGRSTGLMKVRSPLKTLTMYRPRNQAPIATAIQVMTTPMMSRTTDRTAPERARRQKHTGRRSAPRYPLRPTRSRRFLQDLDVQQAPDREPQGENEHPYVERHGPHSKALCINRKSTKTRRSGGRLAAPRTGMNLLTGR